MWPVPILLVCIFCPESPTWRKSPPRPSLRRFTDRSSAVVGHGREAEAEAAVRRLQSAKTGFDIATPQETVALLAETNAFERRLTAGVGYMECFRGTNLRRTEIAVGTWTIQQMCGPVLQTYAIYFFEQAGLATSQAFNMTLGLVSLHRLLKSESD